MGFHIMAHGSAALRFARRPAGVLFACMALALAACQGNIGSSGITIPQAPGMQQYAPAGGPITGTTGDERDADGAVFLASDLHQIPFPTIGGFKVVMDLTSFVPTPAPSASPVPKASPTPAPAPSGASPSPIPLPKHSASPRGPKVVTKTVLYPDDAPVPPTPDPVNDVETIVKREAIVRAYLMPATDVTIAGVSAVHFTITKAEETPQRGFTVAIYETGKHHHDKLLDYDTAATLANDVVTGSPAQPIEFKKNSAYQLVLYGDEPLTTPAPISSGYPLPGSNPIPGPSGVTPIPGQPLPIGATPFPGQPLPAGATYPPGTATATPFP